MDDDQIIPDLIDNLIQSNRCLYAAVFMIVILIVTIGWLLIDKLV